MPPPAWSPSWCPGCSALLVQWVVALLPPPERHSWLESDYMVCPRCEAVTVTLPPSTPDRAYASLTAVGRSRWTKAGLAELQRTVGLAKAMGPDRSREAVDVVARISPKLRPVLREATEEGELPDALLALSVALDMVRSGLRARPRPRSRSAETRQLSELIEELRDSLAPVVGGPAAPAAGTPSPERDVASPERDTAASVEAAGAVDLVDGQTSQGWPVLPVVPEQGRAAEPSS